MSHLKGVAGPAPQAAPAQGQMAPYPGGAPVYPGAVPAYPGAHPGALGGLMAQSWLTLMEKAPYLYGHTATVVNNQVFVWGGFMDGNDCQKDCYLLTDIGVFNTQLKTNTVRRAREVVQIDCFW